MLTRSGLHLSCTAFWPTARGCQPTDNRLCFLQWNVAALAITAVLLLASQGAQAAPQSRRLLEQTISARRSLLVSGTSAFIIEMYSAHNLQDLCYSLPPLLCLTELLLCRLVATALHLYKAMVTDTAHLQPRLCLVSLLSPMPSRLPLIVSASYSAWPWHSLHSSGHTHAYTVTDDDLMCFQCFAGSSATPRPYSSPAATPRPAPPTYYSPMASSPRPYSSPSPAAYYSPAAKPAAAPAVKPAAPASPAPAPASPAPASPKPTPTLFGTGPSPAAYSPKPMAPAPYASPMAYSPKPYTPSPYVPAKPASSPSAAPTLFGVAPATPSPAAYGRAGYYGR